MFNLLFLYTHGVFRWPNFVPTECVLTIQLDFFYFNKLLVSSIRPVPQSYESILKLRYACCLWSTIHWYTLISLLSTSSSPWGSFFVCWTFSARHLSSERFPHYLLVVAFIQLSTKYLRITLIVSFLLILLDFNLCFSSLIAVISSVSVWVCHSEQIGFGSW